MNETGESRRVAVVWGFVRSLQTKVTGILFVALNQTGKKKSRIEVVNVYCCMGNP